MTKKTDFDETKTNENLSIVRLYLEKQTRFLDLVIDAISTKIQNGSFTGSEIKYYENTILMILAVGSSAQSILKLAENLNMSIRDCYGISRSICEMCVNILYLSTEEEKLIDQAISHTIQKRFRDLSRDYKYGEFSFKVKALENDECIEIPDSIAESLRQFTRSSGKEIKEWTEDSVEKRIQKIYENNKEPAMMLAAAHAIIYRNSSEILHGTLNGVMYFWMPDALNEEPSKIALFDNHYISVFSSAILSIHSLLDFTLENLNLLEQRSQNNQIFSIFKDFIEGYEKSKVV